MKRICYIPLDDRPVNFKRVLLLAKASGFSIVVPPVDLIKTCLDDQPLNTNKTSHGDVFKLLEWFESLEHDSLDYYIMSIDQIVSGGLVNSRYIDNISVESSIEILNKYLDKKIIKDKKVILIDSILRLTQTAGYQGYGKEEYLNVREYAKVSRKVLIEPYSINDIIENYEVDELGNYIDYKKYKLSEDIKNKYLDIRKRKIIINDFLLSKINQSSNIYYMLGVDDSNPSITIQTNEINFFRKRINSEKGIVFTGIDELCLMAIAKISKFSYSKNNTARLKLHYIGGMEDYPGDPYDTGTIRQSLNYHIEALDAKQVETNEDINVVMLTYKQDEDKTNNTTVKQCINLINELLDQKKLVVVMDLTSWNRYGPLQKELVKSKRLGEILAYSNWNTTANIVGISLSQALARYYYIKNEDSYDKMLSHKAFVELITHSYLKDIGYKVFGQFNIKKDLATLTNDKDAYLNFYKYIDNIDIDEITYKYLNNEEFNPCATNVIIDSLINHPILAKIDNGQNKYHKIKTIKVLEYNYCWYRTFEMDIELSVDVE